MAAAAAATGIKMGYDLWAGMQQAEMVRMQSGIQQQIDEMNAKYAEVDAWNARKTGRETENAYDKQIDQTLGDQRVALAAQNVDLNFGTAAELQGETQITGFMNKIDLQNQARAKALGYDQQARSIRLKSATSSAEAEARASAALMGGIASAAGTGISGYQRTTSPVRK